MRTTLQLLTDNYLDLDILADSAVSSEQTAFPVSNAYNRNRRSKVWRSEGYFNVTSSNNQIIFREDIGIDLTATIAVGEYATISAMSTAIKAALDAAGSSIYTVANTSGTNFKFQISSNGGGGSGLFELILSNVGFTSYDLLGFAQIDLSGALTYTADTLRINSGEFILWDMGISSKPTAFALTGPRNKPLKISPNSIVKIQGNPTNNWTSPAFEQALTYDGEVLFTLNKDGLGSGGNRYWRMTIEDQNPNGFVEVGAFFLGRHYEFSQGGINSPIQTRLVDNSIIQRSEGGQEYSDKREQLNEYAMACDGATLAETDEIESIFEDYGSHSPFFVVLDGDQAFSSSLSRRVKFVKFAARPLPYQITGKKFFTITFEFREQL